MQFPSNFAANKVSKKSTPKILSETKKAITKLFRNGFFKIFSVHAFEYQEKSKKYMRQKLKRLFL